MPLNYSDLPASSATIFYPSINNSKINEIISSADSRNGRVELLVNEMSIILNSEEWEAGNIVAITILKLLNFMKRRFGAEIRSDKRICSLLESRVMVGVAFEPDLTHNDPRIGLISEILIDSGGVLFNGETIYDDQFQKILLA